MTKKSETIRSMLVNKGYSIQSLNEDNYGRFKILATNNLKVKCFIKAVIKSDRKIFKSLWREGHVSKFLSEVVKKKSINNDEYFLEIPEVLELINEVEALCVVFRYEEGQLLSEYSIEDQGRLIFITLDLVNKINNQNYVKVLVPFLTNYRPINLLLTIPFRIAKALIFNPFDSIQLIATSIKSLSLIKEKNLSLVHPDINSSNIIINGKKIFLIDWEEAGWGISSYNILGPVCSHWDIEFIRNKLLPKIVLSVFAYRILLLFNQPSFTLNQNKNRNRRILNAFGKNTVLAH